MEFTPKTEEEIKAANLLEAGDYDFDVLVAEDAISSKGNEMIKVNLGIYTGDKVRGRIFDYLMPSMEAKLRHFCDTVGLLKEYESGSLSANMCEGRSGKCRIIIQEDKAGKYDPKNTIKDYICRSAKPLGVNKQENKVDGKIHNIDEDIPF